MGSGTCAKSPMTNSRPQLCESKTKSEKVTRRSKSKSPDSQLAGSEPAKLCVTVRKSLSSTLPSRSASPGSDATPVCKWSIAKWPPGPPLVITVNSSREIPVSFTGTRPGEKLYEELLAAEEGAERTKYDQILVVRRQEFPEETLNALLAHLFAAAYACDEARIKSILKELIPTYQPSSDGQ